MNIDTTATSVMEAHEYLAKLPPDQFATVVLAVLESEEEESRDLDVRRALATVLGNAELSILERDPAMWIYGLFKLLSDAKGVQARWETLRENTRDLDRDEIVLRLWQILDQHHGAEVENRVGSRAHLRMWLFEWFSSRRYDLRRARRALGAGASLCWTHVFLALCVFGVLTLRREGYLSAGVSQLSTLGVGIAYAVAIVAQAACFRTGLTRGADAVIAAVQSLVPRLAGASAVGLVVLASSEELLNFVAGIGKRPFWPLWLAGLLLGGYGYLLLEMGRRVQPLPRLRRLAFHGFDIMITALIHSVALALVAEGSLVRILHAPNGGPPFTWSQSLSVVVFIVTIGLIINLIWAEKPMTEPL